MDTLADIKIINGRLVTPDGVRQAALTATGGLITGIGTDLPEARRTIDAKGNWVLPGGVDSHAHIEQRSGMGLFNADTFETATASAALGGTTTVISFAAQSKGERLRTTVEHYAARSRRGARIDHAFHLSISDTNAPDFESDLKNLADEGHRSLKVFTTYNIGLNDAQILGVLMAAREAGQLVCVHAENDAMIAWMRAALVARGKTAPPWHAVSRPRLAEVEAVGRICTFAEFTGTPVMLFHISTVEALGVIAATRKRGGPVWAETCPHYLLSDDNVLTRADGGKWMCSPPQRTAEDSAALWQGLADGTLDLVSSDHAPYRYDETGKLANGPGAPFTEIANGLPGLQTRLPLLFDAMVSGDKGGVEAFARVTATAPADLYGLPGKGRIAAGADADLVIWDPARRWTYGANDLADNVGYNPWEGHSVTGWPVLVVQRGRVIVEDGKLLAEPGDGKWLERPALGATPPAAPAPEVREMGGF
ncbi:MAG: dihydropyrimidinase [Pseudomonadota bacterium]